MRVSERVYARGLWTASSPLHTAGEVDPFTDEVDAIILRDSNGREFLPGASIAGACRSYLAQRLLPPHEFRSGERKEPAELHVLFGDDFQSLLTVEDAPGIASPVPVSIRHGVELDQRTGVAKDQRVYNFEVLPAGAQFRLELQLILYDQMPDWAADRFKLDATAPAEPTAVTPGQVKRAFRILLDALSSGDVCFGAKTRRGLGHGRVEQWEVRRLEMCGDRPAAIASWLAQDPYSFPPCSLDDIAPRDTTDCRSRLEIEAYVRMSSPLMVRNQSEGGEVDFAHLIENGAGVLPGTSLAGALRHRAAKIARTIAGESAEDDGQKTQSLIEGVFGYVRKGDRQNPARASRLRVSETRLAHGEDRLRVQGRVSIDRFTGGSLETALFDEAAYWPAPDEPGILLRLTLDDPQPREAGLLALVLKDLWLGDLPAGGEAGVGRGVHKGERLVFRYPGEKPSELFAGNDAANLSANSTNLQLINGWVDDLWQHLARKDGQ